MSNYVLITNNVLSDLNYAFKLLDKWIVACEQAAENPSVDNANHAVSLEFATFTHLRTKFSGFLYDFSKKALGEGYLGTTQSSGTVVNEEWAGFSAESRDLAYSIISFRDGLATLIERGPLEGLDGRMRLIRDLKQQAALLETNIQQTHQVEEDVWVSAKEASDMFKSCNITLTLISHNVGKNSFRYRKPTKQKTKLEVEIGSFARWVVRYRTRESGQPARRPKRPS